MTDTMPDAVATTPKQVEMTVIDAIRMYMKKKADSGAPFKLMIGTPCYGGLVHLGFFQSINDLSINFTKLGIPFDICTIGSESLIPRARNGIVARFMADEMASHLMFIDADITFSWISILHLILKDRDLSGGCYPKKMVNWDKVRHNLKQDGDIAEDMLMAKSLDYVFNPVYQVADGKLTAQVNDGMVKVKDIGTGFMLIKKECLDVLIARHPNLQYVNNVAGYHSPKADQYFYTLFDTAIDEKSRVYLSEDYLFCKRWLECGGDCWLDLGISLNHTGVMDFRGCVALTIGQFDSLNKDFQLSQRKPMEAVKSAEPATS